MTMTDEEHLEKMIEASGHITLTDNQLRTLKWLSSWDDYTVNNICDIMNAIRSK